jgi:hypothetical protein
MEAGKVSVRQHCPTSLGTPSSTSQVTHDYVYHRCRRTAGRCGSRGRAALCWPRNRPRAPRPDLNQDHFKSTRLLKPLSSSNLMKPLLDSEGRWAPQGLRRRDLRLMSPAASFGGPAGRRQRDLIKLVSS